ncbi:TonB-dependent receptor [Hydrogenophaga sp.]|uniref:TonB-dependent receptor n=1 Tax=Hydrogenophaga sp. TaxID=1904254 RepID=UPI002615E043|nr:TonB-dependent receptor [Hydrogenophaga sp.]MCW5655494.1 TonB-dependent receptor [Hydrogenophaga sp.]
MSPVSHPRLRHRPLPSTLALAVHCALAALPSLATAQQQAQPVELAPVTVTVMGEKMGRSAQDSTSAVTVFTAEDIAARDRKTVLELVSEVPNVTIGEFGGIANIRGSNGAGPGFSSLAWRGATRARTATVLDGVSQVWTGGNLLGTGLWDIEQVEVLRGPQSTMQGRSAVGGAIVLKSKDPTFKKEGALRLGLQQANGKLLGQTAAVISGPLSDSLAYRLSADVTGGSHFIDYVDTNANPGVDYSSDPDKVRRSDIKAKLLWAPKDNPDLLSRLDLQHQSQKGPYLNQVNLGDAGDYRASTDQVNHRIGDTTMNTVISNTTYQLDAHRSVDVLMSAYKLDAGFVHNQTAPAVTNTNNYFNTRSDQNGVGLEARLNLGSPDSAMKSMVGASYFKDDLTLLSRTYAGAIRYSGDTKTDATSVFGEVDYPLNDRLSLIAGGRIERESQNRTVTNGIATVGRDESRTYVLPRLAARYKLDTRTVLGLDVRKGYNPAGVSMDTNTSAIYNYETEYVTAVEASLKRSFNEGRGSMAVNVFSNAYKDYQARNGTLISNVDEATIQGIEFEVSSELGRSTHVYANASLQSTKIDKFSANPAYVGNKLPYAAPRTFGVGVNHKLSPQWQVSANAKYVAEYYVDISNAAGAGQKAKAGGYTLVDISTSYDINKQTSVRAFVNNLFDKYVINTYFQGTTTQDVLAPRTVGVQLDYRF